MPVARALVITNYKIILVKFVVIIDDGGELASFGADENKGIGADIVWAKIMIKLFLRYILN